MIGTLTPTKVKVKQASLSGRSTILKDCQSKDHQSQFGPQNIFLEVSAPLDVRHCPKLQCCAISRKTNDESSIQYGGIEIFCYLGHILVWGY